jgi:hypothetical protein
MTEIDGVEKFALTIRTRKNGFHELTLLASSFDEQEEWGNAIQTQLKSLTTSGDGSGSPDEASPSVNALPVELKGWLDFAGKREGEWAEKYCSISALGFSWDDGESADDEDGTGSPTKDVRLKLVAESAEAYGAWIVALKWLEGGCKGRAPRDDPRMYPGGIPPKPLSTFEWTRIQTNFGMLDLPFTKLSRLIHLLQEKRTLGVTQAYSREYLLYATFCCEMYAYQTAASDLEQRLSGIEHAIEACDGLNFKQTMETLCLIGYGKINSLKYRDQVEFYERESEFVALRLIQAACSAFVCLKLESKGKGPKHWFWKKHPGIYRIAVVRARDQRIRTLACLMKLVRRQRPVAKLVEYLQKEKDLKDKHRDFQKEQEAIKEQKRMDALPKAEKRRELARIHREKRLAAEAAAQEETVQNPLAGSSPHTHRDGSGMRTPEKQQPGGLSVQIPGEDGEDSAGPPGGGYESKKQREKREKKEAKKRAKEVKKREKEAKKQQKQQGNTDGEAAAAAAPAPAVAPRPGDSMEVEGVGALGIDSDKAALAMISGDASEQLADLDGLDSLEVLGTLGAGDEV